MFGIGPMEAIIIALIAVIFVGPDKLPGVLKKFGRFYVQAKRHANDVKSGFDQAIHEAERELELERIRELQKEIHAATNLANIIDADHTDTSKPALSAPEASDPTHTADGRLIQPSSQSAMPPHEAEQTVKEAYHEGHLPAQTRNEDHDPFTSDALRDKNLHDDKKA
jgi:sec-independent protein translocase protein TatB